MNLNLKLILVISKSLGELRPFFDLVKPTPMQIQMAFSGRDGLNKALLQQPDLILLDISLPDMEGFAACRQFKALAATRATPVIFLADSNALAERLMGLSVGAVDYVSKPFSEHELLARINIHLSLAREVKELNLRLSKASP